MVCFSLTNVKGLHCQKSLNFLYSSVKILVFRISNNQGLSYLSFSNNLNNRVHDREFERRLKKVREVVENSDRSVISWEKLISNLSNISNISNIRNTHSFVLNNVLNLSHLDTIVEYYKYVLSTGGTFLDTDLCTLIKHASRFYPDAILKHEELFIDLFHKTKYVIKNVSVMQKLGVKTFAFIPSCYKELLEMKPKDGREFVCAAAFQMNEGETGFDLLEKMPSYDPVLLHYFLFYCMHLAFENKFSPDLISKFVNVMQKKGFKFYSYTSFCEVFNFVNVLNCLQDEFVWSFNKCSLKDNSKCNNCSLNLSELKLSNEEYEKMLKLVRDAVVYRDTFMKSSTTEVENFEKFLLNCKPYNCVVDGLNLHHFFLGNVKFVIQSLLKEGKSILIITRTYCRVYEQFKDENIQIFYASHRTEEDIFMLYATLRGDRNTQIVSNDFFNRYLSKFNNEIRNLFNKWQHSHQIFVERYKLLPVGKHMGLAQCTRSNEDGFTWHIPYTNEISSVSHMRQELNWLCLEANRKK